MRKRTFSVVLCFLVAIVMAVPAFAASDSGTAKTDESKQTLVDSFIAAQHALLDDPAQEYWPATRWWLAEGLHTDATIKREVKRLHNMGISSIEIVCMPESNVDNGLATPPDAPAGKTSKELYGWGSEEWTHDTKLIIQEATKYGMGFSMTSGTHWSNANLPIDVLTPEDDGAGKSLGYAIQTVSSGNAFSDVLKRSPKTSSNTVLAVTKQDLVAVVAVKRDDANTGSVNATTGQIASTANNRMLYTGDSIVLTDQVTKDGTPVTERTMEDETGAATFSLTWTPPDSATYDIYSFWMQGTGQSPTPSASKNVTINYIDKAGMDAFIGYYRDHIFNDQDLAKTIRQNGQGEMYMDSLEISANNGTTGQFWGYTLKDEFKARRGYDITPYLPYIIRTGGGFSASVQRTGMGDKVKEDKIRADLYETMTDMYTENILQPLKDYLNEEMNMKLRAEISYGVNYEITTPAQAVDYIETESLEFSNQLDAHRTLAGAAHAYGLRYSSETGALMRENYLNAQDKYMQIINTQFASGISHTVLHGYSSIEGADGNGAAWNGTYWPGHEGMQTMFSERYGPRQPESEFYDDYFPMIARNQAILQQGKPQMDLAIMRTDYDYDNGSFFTAGLIDRMRNQKAVYFKDLSLQDAGYTYDYFAPEILENLKDQNITEYRKGEGLIPDNAGYQALILYQDSIRIESAEKILELAKKGLPVVIVNGLTEHLKGSNEATYAKAAIHTLSNDNKDGELAKVMSQLKRLSNVREVTPAGLPDNPMSPAPSAVDYEKTYFYGKTGVSEALASLGVKPRAAFEGSNPNFLTFTRKTNDTLYLWVYNYMDKSTGATDPATVKIDLKAVGKPYAIDTWTSNVEEVGAYSVVNGRTLLDVTLNPGATTVIALDLKDKNSGQHAIKTTADKVFLDNSGVSILATKSGSYTTTLDDGNIGTNDVVVPENIPLDNWNLVVRSWTPGAKRAITENRAGYTTKEVYYETDKTDISVGSTALIPWKDISAVGPAVSGIGTYDTTFTLPQTWSAANGAYLNIPSTGGSLSAVYVNGTKAEGYDFVSGKIDVSKLLKPGANTVEIQVASTLRNKLKALGYSTMTATSVADYGLIGTVTLKPYTIARVTIPVIAEEVTPTAVSLTSAEVAVSAIANRQYTGKQIKPAVTVTVSGKALSAATDYTLSYGTNKAIGKATVKIDGKGNYSGTRTVTFKIVPKQASVKKVITDKKQIKLTWKKVSAAQKVTRYQIQYRVKGAAKWKTKTVSAKKASLTIKKLQKGKKYQVRIRAYKTVSGVKYYAPWSKTKISGKVK